MSLDQQHPPPPPAAAGPSFSTASSSSAQPSAAATSSTSAAAAPQSPAPQPSFLTSTSLSAPSSGSSKPPARSTASYPPPPPPWYFSPLRPVDPTTAPVLSVHPRVKLPGGGMPEKFWRGIKEWRDPSAAVESVAGASSTKSSKRKGKAPASQVGDDGLARSAAGGGGDDGGPRKTAPGPATAQAATSTLIAASSRSPSDPSAEPIANQNAPSTVASASPTPKDEAAARAPSSSLAAPTAATPTLTSPAVASSLASPAPASTPAPIPASSAAVAPSSSPASPSTVTKPLAAAAPAETPSQPSPAVVKPAAKSWAALLRSTAVPATSSANGTDSSSAVPSGTQSSSSSSSAGLNGAARPAVNGAGKAGQRSNLVQLLSNGPAAGELWQGWRASGSGGKRVGARGLVNRGNLCFVNSILQVLVFTHEFYNLFSLLGELLPADIAGEYPLLEAMISFLREFPPASSVAQSNQAAQYPTLNGLGSGSSASGSSSPTPSPSGADAFVPEHVYTAMSSIARFDFMRQGHQEDAEEFLGFFLNTLHDEALALLNSQPHELREAVLGKVDDLARPAIGEPAASQQAPEPSSSGADGWMEVGKKGKGSLLRQTGEAAPTALTRLFTGSNRSTLTIPTHPSLKPSISIEPFSPLQLDIQPQSVDSIENALRHHADPETIHGVTLPGGRGAADAQRRTELETLPKVLVCHLKRFGWEEGARKMGKVVAFGETLEVPREAIAPSRRPATSPRYKLFGVVYHHGPTVSSGHYTSAVLSRTQAPASTSANGASDDQWLHIDDEVVTPVSVADVCISNEQARAGQSGDIGGRERCAYLVFYERVE